MTPEPELLEPITRAYLTGAFRKPVVVTAERVAEFLAFTESLMPGRARRAIRITGIAVASRFPQAGEFLGRGFGRCWFAEYAV